MSGSCESALSKDRVCSIANKPLVLIVITLRIVQLHKALNSTNLVERALESVRVAPGIAEFRARRTLCDNVRSEG